MKKIEKAGKGLFLLVFSLCMVGFLMPVTAHAQEEEYKISLSMSNITWDLDYNENPQHKQLYIYNEGTKPTGMLTIEVEGDNANCFTIYNNSISNLYKNSSGLIEVYATPPSEAGEYNATLKVSGSNNLLTTASLKLILNPEQPSISYPSFKDKTYQLGETADTLTVIASVNDGGTLSYEWGEGSAETTPKIVCTEPTFTPPTNKVGITSYYCRVKNTKNGVSNECCTNYVTITVVEKENVTPSTITTSSETKNQTTEEEPVVNEISYGNFLENSAEEIQNIPSGGTLTIEGGVWHTLSRNVMLALEKRRDITVVFTFRYKNKDYCIEIPTGAAIDTKEPYYGPLYLMQLYGIKN